MQALDHRARKRVNALRHEGTDYDQRIAAAPDGTAGALVKLEVLGVIARQHPDLAPEARRQARWARRQAGVGMEPCGFCGAAALQPCRSRHPGRIGQPLAAPHGDRH